MTESLREKAIEGYLDRDDGVDWMGLMTYANSMFDVRDSIKPNLPAFKFDGEEARRLFNEHFAYLKAHPLIVCFRSVLLKPVSSLNRTKSKC